ncbi:MAG TPA: hypothetical protein VEF04_12555 [Blastocatellia bacterium]|nr:hypothetical protein [Blastocatellia bacterium]
MDKLVIEEMPSPHRPGIAASCVRGCLRRLGAVVRSIEVFKVKPRMNTNVHE